MGARKDKYRMRAADQKLARHVNGPLKAKETARRDARMVASLKAGKLPYTRPVRNWLSVRLGKPEAKITQADVDAIVKAGK